MFAIVMIQMKGFTTLGLELANEDRQGGSKRRRVSGACYLLPGPHLPVNNPASPLQPRWLHNSLVTSPSHFVPQSSPKSGTQLPLFS